MKPGKKTENVTTFELHLTENGNTLLSTNYPSLQAAVTKSAELRTGYLQKLEAMGKRGMGLKIERPDGTTAPQPRIELQPTQARITYPDGTVKVVGGRFTPGQRASEQTALLRADGFVVRDAKEGKRK